MTELHEVLSQIIENPGSLKTENEYLTLKELMGYMKISERNVHYLKEKGVLKPYRFRGSRKLYFLKSEVDEAMKAA